MKAIKPLLACVWLVALGAALFAVTEHTRAARARHVRLLDMPPMAQMDTRVIDVAMLGHRGLWDDFASIWLLQILTDPTLSGEDPEAVAATIRSVTRHKTGLETIYMLACFQVGLEMHRPDLCERISLDGLEAFPNGWRIPATQGFMYAFRLNDKASAAKYYGLAASRPDAPPFMKRLAASLAASGELSESDAQESLDRLLELPGGGRLGDVLKGRRGRQPPLDPSPAIIPVPAPESEPEP